MGDPSPKRNTVAHPSYSAVLPWSGRTIDVAPSRPFSYDCPATLVGGGGPGAHRHNVSVQREERASDKSIAGIDAACHLLAHVWPHPFCGRQGATVSGKMKKM